jgi:hypothetical protein
VPEMLKLGTAQYAYLLNYSLAVIIGKRHPLIAYPVEEVWKRFAKEGVQRCVEHAERLDVIFGLENARLCSSTLPTGCALSWTRSGAATGRSSLTWTMFRAGTSRFPG